MPKEWVESQMEKYKKRQRENEKITWITIYNQAREKFDISVTEYSVCAIIESFSNAPKSKLQGGWCYASKKHIADCLGINKRTVERAIVKLITKELLEKQPETRNLRTTTCWFETVHYYRNKARS